MSGHHVPGGPMQFSSCPSLLRSVAAPARGWGLPVPGLGRKDWELPQPWPGPWLPLSPRARAGQQAAESPVPGSLSVAAQHRLALPDSDSVTVSAAGRLSAGAGPKQA